MCVCHVVIHYLLYPTVILLTDGYSNSRTSTAYEAQLLQALEDVHVFAVGIGGYSITEINGKVP